MKQLESFYKYVTEGQFYHLSIFFTKTLQNSLELN